METKVNNEIELISNKIEEIIKHLDKAEQLLDDKLVSVPSNIDTEDIIIRIYLLNLRDTLSLSRRQIYIISKHENKSLISQNSNIDEN